MQKLPVQPGPESPKVSYKKVWILTNKEQKQVGIRPWDFLVM